jgi:Asp-tRNA(Asn)/Glu-tRNA(Gln) amidotransferase C subunit
MSNENKHLIEVKDILEKIIEYVKDINSIATTNMSDEEYYSVIERGIIKRSLLQIIGGYNGEK